ncbi:oligoendopeptidase F [Syntrophomonas wolfei]|uniref:Oligopeptidase F n=1 Tax=Syntrophomonas wolfei subsp. wolfei (strain DSM 2245B / Goettingen) TaxID=335541 RepID=Q0AVN7_SYNWW|nr:oligoendopeptidase F [Syntrophomonas wolfei]ABI69217.1 oligopeptidase F. Metallo peptidase. MEROPS family M03B [Syntrophomonas wolfei subsp. wolfei str. Goettingen G311]
MEGQSKKREEIGPEYKWKLEDIYADENSWEEDYKKLEEQIPALEKYKGVLGSSSTQLLQVLEFSHELERKAEKLYVYARMRRDEDNGNSHYQALFDRVQRLSIELGSASAYIVPEIISLAPEKIRAFLDENQDLQLYSRLLDELMRQKEHILSPEEERILAMSADLSLAAKNIFGMLNNADIKFPVIQDEEGKAVELTKGRYGSFMESNERRVRKEAFTALYGSYGKVKNTLAMSLASNVKNDIFYSRVRKYPSALEASLDQDNISPEVYERLVETVHNNMEPMYRYLRLRKKALGLDELHMYDIYAPLVKEFKSKVSYEKSQEMVLKALQPLGDEYLAILRGGLKGGWIDVYENEGKTSGAYSWGCYDSHPYVLMNYDDKLDDVFTLAHEMGHALHSYYSNKNQPYVYSQYSIFVAEVASTVNELLLIDYLLAQSREPREKAYLINHYLEQFRGTVYRQTMFAEFEKKIHEQVEQGQTLTADGLCQSYRELNRLYYGTDTVLDEEIDMEWARIPHFYSAFYVYKYATGFSAAVALKEQILQEGKPAVARYLEFLKSGSSDYPLNLLKKAGVDLTTPEPVEKALHLFARLVAEMEAVLNV